METIWTWLGDVLTNPVIVAAVSAVAALVAVPVSVIALVSAHRTSSRMVQIEEERDRAAEQAARKANVRAGLVNTDRGFYILVVRNDGPGTARNIALLLDGAPASKHPAALSGPLPDSIDELHPSAEGKFSLVATLGTQFPSVVEMTWEDDSGKPGVFRSHL
jgi:hypothetical protein